ncbi:response regulator transcription factor [Marinobacter caseinilyticus]|uniref:response regulator transcription factor n=1 Tax=Marinobacter caseinilyticus TaxID=2692195 RepID=UPI00140D2D1F|nr:response regulator [Marinobacter caseinilyticus]
MLTEQVIHVVDDDLPFLAAIERTLRSTGLTVRGYTCARALLDEIDLNQPGCIVTDLRMPDMNGLELQQALDKRHCHLPIIFITGHGDATTAVIALKGGAMDFLTKPFSEKDLLNCVAQALQKNLIDRRLAGEQAVVRERYTNLTPREQQVFRLVVSDLPNKLIARQLKISPRTVEHHREHVMHKMQAHSATELLTMAMLCGIRELHL